MSTIFFIGQNPATGNQTLYSVTAGTLGSIMDSFNPDKDIVEQIWQKRYVFLNATYFDSMKEHAREMTDISVVPRGTADKSVVKCRNLKTDDVKVRFLRNNISQYKRESDISLLIKIEDCASDFTLFESPEQIQLMPNARHIQELFITDGDINIYKASDVVSTSTGGNIIAWRVGSYNGHSIITLENSPDAQKYVLVSEDVIVGVADTIPADFFDNAVPVNAQFTVGEERKPCLISGNENVHAPLDAHTTHEVLRQWKTYFELSLSNASGTVIVTIDGCHVDYNVYAEKPLQYIELTQRVEIEGSLSSIGSRWKVESMDENGIVPEINIFTPDVKETITNYDAFKLVNDNPCIPLQNTTVTATQSVLLRPSFSLEDNEGRNFGKLPVGAVYDADMVVYDGGGRAWFHITSDTPIELEQSAGIFTCRGWVNGKASTNYIFSEIEPTVIDDRNVRVKECTYITVKQDLGPVDGEQLSGNAYAMTEIHAVTVEDGEPHELAYGDMVQLVKAFLTKFQFTHNGVLCELPIASLGVDVRRECVPEFASFVPDSENSLQIGGEYLCAVKGESLSCVKAFVEDDFVESTDDVITGETLTGNHVFQILGQFIHGSYRYVQLREGDEEEGITCVAKYSDIIIPSRYVLAESDRLNNFTPNEISLKKSPFLGAHEAELVPAGTTLDLSDAFGVSIDTTNWGIGLDEGRFTDAPLYEKAYASSWLEGRVFGTTVSGMRSVLYKDGDSVEEWSSQEAVEYSIQPNGRLEDDLALSVVRKTQDLWDVNEHGILCERGYVPEQLRIPIHDKNVYFSNGYSPDKKLIVIGGTLSAYASWNGDEAEAAENCVFVDHSYWIPIEGETIDRNVPPMIEYHTSDGFTKLIHWSEFTSWSDTHYLDVYDINGSQALQGIGSVVRMSLFSEINEDNEYFTEEDLGTHALRVIDSDSNTHKVCRYYVKTRTACGDDGVMPIETYETKDVESGVIPNVVKKLTVRLHNQSHASDEVFYISDDGYAYPENILENMDEPLVIRFSEPKYVWVTKDPTVDGVGDNPAFSDGEHTEIKIRQDSSLSGITNAPYETRDPHGFFLKLLGSTVQNIQDSTAILLAEIDGQEVFIDIMDEENENVYVVEVTNEDLKVVFVGNPEESTYVEFIDTVNGDIAESDAFDYYTPILHAGDIVTCTKSFMGVNEKVYLFVNEENGVVHSVKASRLASDFIDIQELFPNDAPQYYFKDRSSVLAPMTYQLNGENISESELNSVDKRAVMFANVDNPYMVYIAPGVATDAYRSARVSLHQPLVLNDEGTVDVTAYMYLIPSGRMSPKYSASYNGVTYYGFELGVTTNTEVIGEVIVWAAPVSLDQVIPATMEDCDLQVFPNGILSLYSDYSLSSSRTDYAVDEMEGHESIDRFQEFHLDKSVIQNGSVTFYRISQDSGIFSGKYIPSDMVRCVIEDVTENIQLFHKKDPQFAIVAPVGLGTLPVIAHSLYMTPTRKFTADMGANGVHTWYEVMVTLSGSDDVPYVHTAWVCDTDCYIVQVPSEAVSINDETVTVHANANAYLWDAADAPVMHVFAEERTFNDFSVVSDENGDRYICVEMARSEMNNADSHISVDDPTTPDVNESTEALRVFIPASDVTRNKQGSSNTFLDVADFNVYLGTQSVSMSKADGSGASLSGEEESALLEYLASRQNVAHIDAAYVDENDSVVMYRIASESSPVEYYACINIQELEEYWIMNRTVVPLTGQDAVVVDSQEDDGESVGDILTVLWKFTTTEEDAEFFNCGVAVPVDDEQGSEEIVKIVEV